jgi:hypothetical protein
MKLLFLSFYILPSFYLSECPSLEKKDVSKYISEYDYVIIGKAEEVVEYYDSLRLEKNTLKFATDVKFKVERVIKGEISDSSVLINQMMAYNSRSAFNLGENYVIVGNRVKEFRNATPEYKDPKPSDAINESLQPPPAVATNGIVLVSYTDKKVIDFWQALSRKHTIITTHACLNFPAESKEGKWFASYGKK